jgi:hypothetical protein
MINHEVEIDHIDPRWEEGRDYQLVCGFEKDPKNLREEYSWRNGSKSNRFLPWRWSREELVVIPEEPGDLALFLDPDTNEWVLEEFMGEWWYEKTWKTCGPYLGTITGGYVGPLRGRFGPEHPKYGVVESEETRKKKSEASKGKPKGENHKKKLRQNLQKIAKERKGKPGKKHTTGSKQKMSKTMRSIRVMCLVTGFTTTPGALTGYQKARGIDPSNRVRIE